MMYPLLRNALFQLDAEGVHYFSMNALKTLGRLPFVTHLVEKGFRFTSPLLQKELFGLTFKNPVGLGAGFDKNALYLNELELFGFGFVEVGTVTPQPQAGNPKPRLFRLPADEAIINRMGFNNDGVKQVAHRLRARLALPQSSGPGSMIIGGNIGKNKDTPNDQAWKDYEICFQLLFDCIDYFVINLSSPNTPGLRALQEKEALTRILSHLQHINQGKINPRPLLLKIAPDITWQQADDIIEIAGKLNLSGLVATNTTISRQNLLTPADEIDKSGAGGLSGKPLKERATEVVRYIHQQTNGKLAVIASGAILQAPMQKKRCMPALHSYKCGPALFTKGRRL